VISNTQSTMPSELAPFPALTKEEVSGEPPLSTAISFPSSLPTPMVTLSDNIEQIISQTQPSSLAPEVSTYSTPAALSLSDASNADVPTSSRMVMPTQWPTMFVSTEPSQVIDTSTSVAVDAERQYHVPSQTSSRPNKSSSAASSNTRTHASKITQKKLPSAGATIRPEKLKYYVSDVIKVEFANPGASQGEWIGVYPSGEAEKGYLPWCAWYWVYACGTQTCSEMVARKGTVSFHNLEPGTYQAFILEGNEPPFPVVAASDTFDVLDEIAADIPEATFPPENEQGTEERPMQAGEVSKSEEANFVLTEELVPAELSVQSSDLDYAPVFISVDRPSYNETQSVIVSFTNPNPGPRDWIGIYPAGSERNGFVPWDVLEWAYACGNGSLCDDNNATQLGTLKMGPFEGGIYEAFLLSDQDPPYPVIAASQPFMIGQSNFPSPMPTTSALPIHHSGTARPIVHATSPSKSLSITHPPSVIQPTPPVEVSRPITSQPFIIDQSNFPSPMPTISALPLHHSGTAQTIVHATSLPTSLPITHPPSVIQPTPPVEVPRPITSAADESIAMAFNVTTTPPQTFIRFCPEEFLHSEGNGLSDDYFESEISFSYAIETKSSSLSDTMKVMEAHILNIAAMHVLGCFSERKNLGIFDWSSNHREEVLAVHYHPEEPWSSKQHCEPSAPDATVCLSVRSSVVIVASDASSARLARLDALVGIKNALNDGILREPTIPDLISTTFIGPDAVDLYSSTESGYVLASELVNEGETFAAALIVTIGGTCVLLLAALARLGIICAMCEKRGGGTGPGKESREDTAGLSRPKEFSSEIQVAEGSEEGDKHQDIQGTCEFDHSDTDGVVETSSYEEETNGNMSTTAPSISRRNTEGTQEVGHLKRKHIPEGSSYAGEASVTHLLNTHSVIESFGVVPQNAESEDMCRKARSTMMYPTALPHSKISNMTGKPRLPPRHPKRKLKATCQPWNMSRGKGDLHGWDLDLESAIETPSQYR